MRVLTGENFKEETSKGLVLIDFYADWCGPCKMMAPVLEKVAKAYEGKLEVVKVNVDDEMELARDFNVVSIPNMFLLKDGEVVNSILGYHPEKDIVAIVEAAL